MQSELFCKSPIGRRHLLKEPKVLPCKNVICKNCILLNMGTTKIFTCNCASCTQPHYIEDINSLPIDTYSIELLDTSLKDFTANRVEELKSTIERIRGEYLPLKLYFITLI